MSLLLGVSLFILPACALSIRGYDPARHDRFASGYPGSPVENVNFHAAYYDFSGVGWNQAAPYFSYTLISPLHFVGANHVQPPVGTIVTFRGRDGVLKNFTVANIYHMTNTAGQNTDVFIGELDRPVPACDNLTFYPILNLGAEANYAGKPLLVYGATARVGKGTIGAFQDFGGDPITGGAGVNSTRAYSFTYLNATGSPDDCHGEGGDSGSPSFVAMDGELFIAGVHTAIASAGLGVVTFDSFVPSYLNQIRGVLQAQGYLPATSAPEVFRLCYQLTSVTSNVYQLSWTGQRGRVYQVDAATNLLNFIPISGRLTANVAKVTYSDSNSVNRVKFYRVRRVDSP